MELYNDILKAIMNEITNYDDNVAKPTKYNFVVILHMISLLDILMS